MTKKLSSCNSKKTNQEIDDLVSFLKAISEENRLRILCILKKQALCVCEIWQVLDLPQNLVSHHLRVLKDFGLVVSEKDGTKVIYSLNRKNTEKYLSFLSKFI